MPVVPPPTGILDILVSFLLGLENTTLGPSERQRWRNSTAVFRSLPPHPIPCLSRIPLDGVLGMLGLTVLGGVLCERVSNGVASIHPGPFAGGNRENPAGMVVCPRGTPVGSTQFSASCSGDAGVLKHADNENGKTQDKHPWCCTGCLKTKGRRLPEQRVSVGAAGVFDMVTLLSAMSFRPLLTAVMQKSAAAPNTILNG